MVRLFILALENLCDLLADGFIWPFAILDVAPLAHRNGLLVDELCNLDSDLHSMTVSNYTIEPITIDGLNFISVAVIVSGMHGSEQFTDNVPFLNLLIRPIKKSSILPTIPNYCVQFVPDVLLAHLCA